MKRKSSGVAVVAILVGVAVAVTLYIASFGRSSHHAGIATPTQDAVAAHDVSASEAAITAAPMEPVSGSLDTTAAR
ncbi:hypothetical protein P9239_01160 [Caballeronia sp. LZ062]|uniref:hypothetical protein n=1 Tax=unclassified Caballeronia TaxID=2646786 RepID=UPI00285B1F2A|nr:MULTISPECIES: hypothetical protein [unclassified Caballeronia]MDR5857416.1 hypothetical protein [Caballeronia sp. LZ050]MDR5868967.1 hypothetical protein [Caballeronia sp. LZ062]